MLSTKQIVLGQAELQGIQAMIDALPFYAMLLDEDHLIIAINDATEAALEVSREEILCQYCPQAIHGQDHPYDGCPLEQAVETGRSVEVEIFNPDHGRWYLSMISPTDLLTDPDRKPVYLHFVQDITEKKESNQELERSMEHHRAVSELLQQLQLCHSGSQLLQVVIDRVLALSWSGLTGGAAGFLAEGGELRMAAQRNLDPAVVRQCARVPMGRCLCGKAAQQGQTITTACLDPAHDIQHPEQADHGHVVLPIRHMEQTIAVLSFYLPKEASLEPDKITLLETISAISGAALARLRMQAQLAQSDRTASLGLLAAILAHDIRTPLNALSIQIQRTLRLHRKDRAPRAEESLELLQGLQSEVQRINQQIEDHLLAIVHEEPQHLEPVFANDVMTETRQLMESEADFRGVSLTTDLAPDLPLVMADPRKLRRLLMNLMLNAIQALSDGGQVQLNTRAVAKQVLLIVDDDGPGFAEPLDCSLDQAFQPFSSSKKDGTGLGLAICSRLVTEIGGTIHVSSIPGQGARFEVRLEAADPPP